MVNKIVHLLTMTLWDLFQRFHIVSLRYKFCHSVTV